MDKRQMAMRQQNAVTLESKEQASLERVEALMNKDAKNNIKTELATKKVTSEHFSPIFAQL